MFVSILKKLETKTKKAKIKINQEKTTAHVKYLKFLNNILWLTQKLK